MSSKHLSVPTLPVSDPDVQMAASEALNPS